MLDIFPFELFGIKITKDFFWSGVRYFIVGFTNFLLDFALNWLLIKVFHINYLLVGYIVAPVTFLYGFILHKVWSFKDVGSKEENTAAQFVRLIILTVFNAFMNMPLMFIFYQTLKLPLFWARVFVWACIVLWNFPLMRYWVYRKREKK